ncbi:protein of unknown function [Georgenia satyanarayanai]|uniref:HNH nuclease domain-containing protein n=1 Tax=Georgenia satyanarayanai TaxID=860221 RepID=A0A2Y9AS04_9MICO|nr:HNH endonuclease signature motif containing protein [Georgenia satyanarayanai]PYF98413.1 uncharacterized protein DUF222 [Georgenia satyanarayanai]SSA45059.1 protein of unknown function [Georgenia satyanarayanai]
MSSTDPSGPGTPPVAALRAADVGAMRRLLEGLDPALVVADRVDGERPGLTEAECIDLVRELEDLKAATAGAQVAVTAHLSRLRLDAEQTAGVAADRRGRGLASEVALARRLSPHHGGRHLGMARALREDMPCTLAALRRGELSEWRATLLVRETICLGAEERRALDAELWEDPSRVAEMGDRQLVAEAKRLAYRLDPHSVVDRAARAERERFISIRPAPDTMAYLTALLPVAQAVAAHASLGAAADSARAAGDERGRGQVMADTLVARLTGSDAQVPARVELQLVMIDQSLAGSDEPASVPEHGTVPAGWARDLLRRTLTDEGGCGAWVRRLFTDPAGHLVAMESRARHAPPGLARYVATRDAGRCRTPWCDAPVRHIDHVVDHATGGETAEENLGGRCERCNQDKAAPGWSSLPLSRGSPGAPRAGPVIRTRTPTGHVYDSAPPPLPHAG